MDKLKDKTSNNKRSLKSFYYIIKIITYFFCVLYVCLFYLGEHFNVLTSWVILITIFIKLCLTQRCSSIEFSLDLGLVYLFFIPCMLYTAAIGDKYNIFLTISVLLFDILKFIAQNRGNKHILKDRYYLSKNDVSLWVCFIGMSFINGFLLPSDNDSVIGLFSYIIPFSISLVYFEKILPCATPPKIYIMFGVYLGSVLFYSIFFWSGYGRLVIGVYLLIPFLIADYYYDMKFRIWHLMLLAPVSLGLAQFSRYGSVDTVDLHGGSASHHLILSLDILQSLSFFEGLGWGAFWEQWSLLLLNWFPRNWWSLKPEAVGLTFVDNWMGREGYPESFSVSVGYLGEQLYLLGKWWVVGIIVQFLTILIARKIIIKLSGRFIAPVVVFDVSLIGYIWGGSGVFGARAWFMVIPMLSLVFFYRLKTKAI